VLIIFLFWEFPVSWRSRDYAFLDLVWKKWHDKIRLREFVKDRKFPKNKKMKVPTSFRHPSITDSNEPQIPSVLIVIQKQSVQREPILLYSAGLINTSNQPTPLSTGLLGRPLSIQTLRGYNIFWGLYCFTKNVQVDSENASWNNEDFASLNESEVLRSTQTKLLVLR